VSRSYQLPSSSGIFQVFLLLNFTNFALYRKYRLQDWAYSSVVEHVPSIHVFNPPTTRREKREKGMKGKGREEKRKSS
jgi:hypothetical protein